MADQSASDIYDEESKMAAVATQTIIALPRPHYEPNIEQVVAPKKANNAAVKFDPKKHIAYIPPSEIIMMKDIGYAEDIGVSPVAVSQPFQLFSKETIRHMREEIFKPEVMDNCSFSSNIAACQLRGYAPKYAPFTYDAWNDPETLSIISKIAGVDLIPEMDYEIGHINLSVKTEEQTKEELATINKRKRTPANKDHENDKPIVGWHTDSYPFVCVLMMSDCTNMVGGETALRTATGDVIKVRGPTEGCAVILQGRYITHQALRALGARERITSVTSFRPRSSLIKDNSVLKTVRPISNLSELYYDYVTYRLEILEDRLREKRKIIMASRKGQKKFNTLAYKAFIKESMAFLKDTDAEVVEDNKVTPGYIEEMDYPDVVVGATEDATEDARPEKRARIDLAD